MSRTIAAAALAFALAVSTSSLAGQTDQEKLQRSVAKILKLHCLCVDTNPGGVGVLVQFAGSAPGGLTYLGLRCESPAFDGAGTATGAGECAQFQILSK
jgi:hypothetical protein